MRLAGRLADLVVALPLAALAMGCQINAAPTPSIDVAAENLTVGPVKSCSDLGLSEVRCTALLLRATSDLDRLRPGHARLDSYTLHQPGPPPAGGTPTPGSLTVPLVVVFKLTDGTLVAVATYCGREPSGRGDVACNPQAH